MRDARVYEIRLRVVYLVFLWTRSSAYRLSNARSASSTVDPIPTIPSLTLDPRSAIHNPLRSDNCGRRVAVGLLGCAAQYFIISSLACSGTLVASASTNSKTQPGAMADWSKFYHEAGQRDRNARARGRVQRVVARPNRYGDSITADFSGPFSISVIDGTKSPAGLPHTVE